jgi:hypothetical protein
MGTLVNHFLHHQNEELSLVTIIIIKIPEIAIEFNPNSFLSIIWDLQTNLSSSHAFDQHNHVILCPVISRLSVAEFIDVITDSSAKGNLLWKKEVLVNGTSITLLTV